MQRRVLGSLWDRGETDTYDVRQASDLFSHEFRSRIGFLRARWRWYTIDLLDLVDFGAPRSQRVSVHRAVRALAETGRVQISASCPYDDPFLSQVDDYGNHFGGIDLAEIRQYADPRWPSRQGRSLWFRLPPPIGDYVPDDDQLTCLDLLLEGFVPEAVDEFMGTRSRRRAWATNTAHYLQWLLCGPKPAATRERDQSV